MVDVNQLLGETIRRCDCVQTKSVNEIEELIDTGLEKNEENIQKVAMEYLQEKGYMLREDNLVRAKQHIEESSLYSDTVKVRKRRVMEEDLLAEAESEDLSTLKDICMIDQMLKLNAKLDVVAAPRFQYAVEVLTDIVLESDRPAQGSLTEFESFQMLLNRYAAAGWRVVSITSREAQNNQKLSMAGFNKTTKQVIVVFEHAV
ncbi:MAG: hypothetical protein MJ105_08745 [Lachnospiraceae bacterium]|nr:hypothetical protein [Lachnospiraceae bacterium]